MCVDVALAAVERAVFVDELECVVKLDDLVRDDVRDDVLEEVEVESDEVWLWLVVAIDPMVVGVANVSGDSVKLTSTVSMFNAAVAPSADV